MTKLYQLQEVSWSDLHCVYGFAYVNQYCCCFTI